jgi:hypothetical protein
MNLMRPLPIQSEAGFPVVGEAAAVEAGLVAGVGVELGGAVDGVAYACVDLRPVAAEIGVERDEAGVGRK